MLSPRTSLAQANFPHAIGFCVSSRIDGCSRTFQHDFSRHSLHGCCLPSPFLRRPKRTALLVEWSTLPRRRRPPSSTLSRPLCRGCCSGSHCQAPARSYRTHSLRTGTISIGSPPQDDTVRLLRLRVVPADAQG